MYFRLNNLRNLSGICQEKILFNCQLSVHPALVWWCGVTGYWLLPFQSHSPISPDPDAPRAYPSQIQYRPLVAW